MSAQSSRFFRHCAHSLLLLAGVASLAACGDDKVGGAASAAPAADLLFTNARVYTVEAGQPWAEAVAIDDGKIVAVGSAADLKAYQGEGTQVVDLGGRLLMPSFGDAHVHPVFGGLSYSRCSLHAGKTVEDYQRIIKGCLDSHPGTDAVFGVGWQDGLFPPNGIPRKEVLDALSSDRALIFSNVGGHSYWVNSKALAVAGITKDTPDPENGTIDRDPVTKEPIGGLQESAMALVEAQIPQPTQEELEQSIVYTSKLFNSLGITNWHDALVEVAGDGSSAVLEAYRAVKERGELTNHVALALKWENGKGLEQIPALRQAAARAETLGFKARAVKFFADGVIPQHTAAMIEPYSDDPHNHGTLQITPEMFNAAVTQLGAQGVQPYVHAIGDMATRASLDAFAAAKAANGTLYRPMITHMNVVDPPDWPRFGELGVIAQFQATWSSNYPYMDLTKQVIGPERSQWIYPANSLLKAGAVIAYGADWPVATADPLAGLQVATTRVNYEDTATPPLLPDEAVSLEEAVKAYTINVAYANSMEDFTGSIAKGKSADLVVLDQDIFKIDRMQIAKTKVMLTLFEGKPVHGALDQFKSQPAP
ncbi:amidohydrolase [Niveispirillum irakense]|uniref:amidohydrolase n=1 Tax=Niveispirillum irakense TaxID=34011 RepID=UPI0003FADAA8|nr:amidohydrolase [Niveispirillum irakense]